MRKPVLHTHRQPPRNSKKRARGVDTEEEEEEEEEEDEGAGAPDEVSNEPEGFHIAYPPSTPWLDLRETET